MKKIGLIVKQTSGNRIKKIVENADGVIIVKYSGLSGPDLTALRLSLKGVDANLFILKNSVARRAFEESGLQALIGHTEGPCGLVFLKDEPVAASKVLFNFARKNEKLVYPAGMLYDRLIDNKDIDSLAKLPSKDVLRAQVVMTLKSPITGFVGVLNQTLKKFVYCLDQIKQKKSAQ